MLEVTICTGVVYLLYIVFLKGTTFFRLNRFYLLGGLPVSFIVPLISLPLNFANRIESLPNLSIQRIETEYFPLTFPQAENTFSLNGSLIIASIYGLGVLFLTIRFLYSIGELYRLRKTSRKAKIHGVDLYLHNSVSSFSFYTFIFAPEHVEPMVLRHERVHVTQAHWIDSLVIEIVTIVLWFNPLIFLYKRAIKAQHEFLADQGAMKDERDASAYLLCLLNATYLRNDVAIASHFGSNTLKTRIIMLTKNKTPLYKTMFYFLIVPAVALLLLAFQESAVPAIIKRPNAITGLQSVPMARQLNLARLRVQSDLVSAYIPLQARW